MTTIEIVKFRNVIIIDRKIEKQAKNLKHRRLEIIITLQGAIEKSPILLSQYMKNGQLDSAIIILHFLMNQHYFRQLYVS